MSLQNFTQQWFHSKFLGRTLTGHVTVDRQQILDIA